MTKTINTISFGSCGIHDAPHVIAPLGFFPNIFGKLGFDCSPYALTSGAAIQLYDFCVGDRRLPVWIRMLAYLSKHGPTPDERPLVDDAELAFIEMSSPIEPMIGDDIVNLNRIREFIVLPLRAAGVEPRVLSLWAQSLVNVADDIKERAAALLAAWPANLCRDNALDDDEIRFAVEALRSRRLDLDDMARDLAVLREKLRRPVAIKLYDFKYMPDGRAITWPAGFKAQQVEIARRMNLPTLDMAPVVERFGAQRLLKDDGMRAHFDRRAWPLQAELMYDFWAGVLGRPHLETYPEWRQAKPELFKALPELIDRPARLTFPDLMKVPSPRASGFSAWTSSLAGLARRATRTQRLA